MLRCIKQRGESLENSPFPRSIIANKSSGGANSVIFAAECQKEIKAGDASQQRPKIVGHPVPAETSQFRSGIPSGSSRSYPIRGRDDRWKVGNLKGLAIREDHFDGKKGSVDGARA